MTNIKRLVIDDVREPNFSAVVIRDPVEALAAIMAEPWDEVWMDVDNDFQPGHQYTWVTARVRDYCKQLQAPAVDLWVLHSANSYGRQNMKNHLAKWFRIVDVENYSDQTLRLDGMDKVIDVSVKNGVERKAFAWQPQLSSGKGGAW